MSYTVIKMTFVEATVLKFKGILDPTFTHFFYGRLLFQSYLYLGIEKAHTAVLSNKLVLDKKATYFVLPNFLNLRDV